MCSYQTLKPECDMCGICGSKKYAELYEELEYPDED